jgi:GT2 family glycosyltransferase/glycosyltransferase involved in cell wall biosynthesis
MAFRGREWHPPDPYSVEKQVRQRVDMHNLTLESLKSLFEATGFEMALETDEDGEFVNDAGVAQSANQAYYESLARIEQSIGPEETVNIVLPVYNSLHLVRECIEGVRKHTNWPYILTIVDDASDAHTHAELEKLVDSKTTLITNKRNKGFAATVNRGIKAGESNSKYTCLLNSDVLTTPRWLTKMMLAMKADKRNKIVNPVTNNTALINVPMNEGFSYQAMNASLEKSAVRRYPEIMPTGFCFLVDNETFKTVGYMDEAYTNFGEESDWWMRVITYNNGKTFDRWRAVLADDTYLFHQRSASFATLGEETTKQLRATAGDRFKSAWPTYGLFSKAIPPNRAVSPLKRKRGIRELETVYGNARKPSVCYVVHSPEVCGAMHYIADIINGINAIGGDARLAVVKRPDRPTAEAVAELRTSPIYFDNAEEFQDQFTSRVFKDGVVIAATSEIAPLVAKLTNSYPTLTPLLHVQSYEPSLAPPEMVEELKKNYDLIPNIVSSSGWINRVMKKDVMATINPGVDRDIFYPGDRSLGDERPTVTICLNGGYPFKGAERGIMVGKYLAAIAKKTGKDIRILAYGSDAVQGAPEIVCQGHPSRTRIQRLLAQETDVFVDPALIHSYGMPSLEAIACGVAVVGWDNQGIREYLPKGYDGQTIFKNTANPKEVAIRIFELLFNDEARKTVVNAQYSMAMIDAHDRKKSVAEFVNLLQKNYSSYVYSKKICVVTPHLRKHGGPTTIITMANELAARGHDVTIATVYHDINPEVVRYTSLPIVLLRQDAGNLPPCDLLITNSDNPLNADFEKLPCKKIMLKLSHNPRFKQLEEMGLNCKWDAIVTSSQWLADVCEKPTQGWNYPPVKADRIGWYHYNFPIMRRNPKRKRFAYKDGEQPIVITTLIHSHPSKGSREAGGVFAALKEKYGDRIHLVGVGEVPEHELQLEIPMQYVYCPSRDELAELLFKTDIWLGCSHTEGLGRMTLEAMTGLAACVVTDTGAEFVKHGENAMVAPIGDVNQLMALCQDLIENMDTRKEIAAAGYETAKAAGDPTKFIDNLERVIGRVFV